MLLDKLFAPYTILLSTPFIVSKTELDSMLIFSTPLITGGSTLTTLTVRFTVVVLFELSVAVYV